MIIYSPKTQFRLLVGLWKVGIPFAIYIGIISWLKMHYELEEYRVPIAVVAIPGTVISLLLAFRTNSCYERWWEARIIWGAIVNDSRTWVRQLIEFSSLQQGQNQPQNEVQEMAYRQIAWCYALTRSLRKQNPCEDIEHLLNEAELKQLKLLSNVPNGLLINQAKELRSLYEKKKFDTYQFVELENTLKRLTDSMGRCERIKNTTFPTSYSHLVSILLYLFIVCLPFGLISIPPLGLFVAAITLAFSFLVIDRAADYLQDPFENRPSDTPMLSLSRTIEINIKESLGETDLPDKLTPTAGVLY